MPIVEQTASRRPMYLSSMLVVCDDVCADVQV
jgi:hypothetical protein